jgi:exonuclease III
LAATNRWLTAADACVSRYPTKLAFCSRFRRQREQSEKSAAPNVFFGFCGDFYACRQAQKLRPHKAQKGRRWKTASLRIAQ